MPVQIFGSRKELRIFMFVCSRCDRSYVSKPGSAELARKCAFDSVASVGDRWSSGHTSATTLRKPQPAPTAVVDVVVAAFESCSFEQSSRNRSVNGKHIRRTKGSAQRQLTKFNKQVCSVFTGTRWRLLSSSIGFLVANFRLQNDVKPLHCSIEKRITLNIRWW